MDDADMISRALVKLVRLLMSRKYDMHSLTAFEF